MTTKPELNPCRYCGAKLQIVTTENDEHGCAIERELSCTKCSVIIGYAYSDGEMESCIELANSATPAPVADDALELPKVFAAAYNAWHQKEYGWDMPDPSALRFGKVFSRYFNNKLAAQGYTLRRETMTEAELEWEADELVTRAFTGNIGISDWKSATKDLAKKYRG